jgi:hypothetical protein
VLFVKTLDEEAPPAFDVGAKGLNVVSELNVVRFEPLGDEFVKDEDTPFVASEGEISAMSESCGCCIGGEANRTLLF